MDLLLVNERAFSDADNLISCKWYAFDGGRQIAGPCDTRPDIYSTLRATGTRLSVEAYVAQKDNPWSNTVTIDGFVVAAATAACSHTVLARRDRCRQVQLSSGAECTESDTFLVCDVCGAEWIEAPMNLTGSGDVITFRRYD